MKRYILSAESFEEVGVNELKVRVVDEDLYAICYGIRYPASLAKKLKKQGILSDRLQINYDGLFEADSYIDYRRKVADVVMQYGNYSESSFQFYTVYNRSNSNNVQELSEFKSALNSGDFDRLSEICLTPEMLSYIKNISSKVIRQLVSDIKQDTGITNIGFESEQTTPERQLKSWSKFTGGHVNFSLGRAYVKEEVSFDGMIDMLSNSNDWEYVGERNDQIFYQSSEYPWLNMWVLSVPASYRANSTVDFYFCVPVKICDEDSIAYSIDVQ